MADVAAAAMLRPRLRLALRMTAATANHAVAAKDDALYAALTASQHPGKAYALPKIGPYTTPVDATADGTATRPAATNWRTT